MKIQAVTLDAAGTLIKTRRPVGDIYCGIAADHGASLDPAALGSAFADVFAAMPPMTFPELRGRRAPPDELDRLERRWWGLLVKDVTDRAGGVPAFEPFFTDLYDYFATAQAWVLYPEVEPFLDVLAQREMQVAVVSNFDSRLVTVLRALGIAERVGPIVYSTAAGSAKPDAGIFFDALAALARDPGECLHLGDSASADYDGAVAAGLQAGLLRRNARSDHALETYELRALTEAVRLLGPAR
ncbi:MAG: HAD-IA family hydrolase [Pseudomonadota bacterium]